MADQTVSLFARLVRALSAGTRKQRGPILKKLEKPGGRHAARGHQARQGRGRISARTPNQGRHFIDTMRGMFRWAIDNEHTIAIQRTASR